jgi:hypothetical protein
MNQKQRDLDELIKEIVDKLAWGAPMQWGNYDFEQLSIKVFDKTGVQLSPITLKRIFGKIKYESSPRLHTLNVLAQFLNYSDWRNFQQTKAIPQAIETKTIAPQPQRIKYLNLFKIVGLLFFIIILGSLFLKNHKKLPREAFSFDYQKIGKGIPASVVFKYDASQAPANSLVEIQQNWDKRRRTSVKAADSIHTSIYYYPGFFEAKLVVDNQIMREQNIFIPSNGWITAIEQNNTPYYVSTTQSIKDNIVGISPNLLIQKGLTALPQPIWTNYSFVQQFDIFSDDFSFEATVKNAAIGGTSICQNIQTVLLFEGSVIVIPLAKPGCIADLNLYALNREIEGNKENLSKFGHPTEEWTNLKVIAQNQQLSILINDEVIRKTPIQIAPIRLVGFRFKFNGTGWVKDVKLNDKALLE